MVWKRKEAIPRLRRKKNYGDGTTWEKNARKNEAEMDGLCQQNWWLMVLVENIVSAANVFVIPVTHNVGRDIEESEERLVPHMRCMDQLELCCCHQTRMCFALGLFFGKDCTHACGDNTRYIALDAICDNYP